MSDAVPPLNSANATAATSLTAQSTLAPSAGTVEARAVAAALRVTSKPHTAADVSALTAALKRKTDQLKAATVAHTAAVHTHDGKSLTQRATEAVARIDAQHNAKKPSAPSTSSKP